MTAEKGKCADGGTYVILELEPRVKVLEMHHQGDQLKVVRKTPWAHEILPDFSLDHLAREISKLVVHRVIDLACLLTFSPFFFFGVGKKRRFGV